MRKFRVWTLCDCDGNILLRGRKKDVMTLSYHRYVYQHIFTDSIYRLNEYL